ncbi:hypothetical protein ACLOJK_019963 [Asimina triloba]
MLMALEAVDEFKADERGVRITIFMSTDLLIVNPVQPTLVTKDVGVGHYTLNIMKINGIVAIGTGIVLALITQMEVEEELELE